MASRSNLELRTDKNGNRTGPRPTVGQADPATRRAALNKRLAETQPAPRAKPAAVKQPNAFSVLRAADDLRFRGTRIDDAVDKNSR